MHPQQPRSEEELQDGLVPSQGSRRENDDVHAKEEAPPGRRHGSGKAGDRTQIDTSHGAATSNRGGSTEALSRVGRQCKAKGGAPQACPELGRSQGPKEGRHRHVLS